jgi:hypothetical protein
MTTDAKDEQPTPQNAPAAQNAARPVRLPGRRAIVRARKEQSRRSRPFIIVGGVVVAGLIGVTVWAFVQEYVVPPRQLAVQVQDSKYTRGDVVEFIRFNQRLAEDLGVEFQIGNSLFDALQLIQDNELAFRAAPTLGVAVSPEELEERIEQLLGFPGLTPEERANPRTRQALDEAKRQFLNRVSLTEGVYRDIVRKDYFKQKVRDVLSQQVPRIQPQVHVYEIVLTDNSPQTLQRIERALAAGDSPEQVALEFSQSPDVQRNRGDAGWFPRKVVQEIDALLWGTNDDGSRRLPFGVPSDPQYNSDAKTYNIYVVKEFSEAREINDTVLKKLTDDALQEFLTARRVELSERKELFMDLNSDVYNWVNKQVRLASVRPTPTAQSDLLSQFGGQ